MSRIILRNVSTVPLSLLKVNPYCLFRREMGKIFFLIEENMRENNTTKIRL